MTTNKQEAVRWNQAGASEVTPESVAASRKKAAEQQANACLISAAPEMLEALEASAHWMRTNLTDGAGMVYSQMLAAIQKARGQR
jgi:hypothetical protein